MFGPGAYRPDPTEGITAIADLPPARDRPLQSQRQAATRVRVVVTRPIGTSSPSGRCTTWGISTCGVRVISWSPIRSITVRSVASTSTRTSPIWRHPAVSTPTA